MTTAIIEAPVDSTASVEAPPRDYAQLAQDICDQAQREGLWGNDELTTYEFRYDARRSNRRDSLAEKYRAEIEYYLPYFEKTHGPIRVDDLSTLAQFIKECAACYSYLMALKLYNSYALSFDNDIDKVWAKRMELEETQDRIEGLQEPNADRKN